MFSGLAPLGVPERLSVETHVAVDDMQVGDEQLRRPGRSGRPPGGEWWTKPWRRRQRARGSCESRHLEDDRERAVGPVAEVPLEHVAPAHVIR